MPDAKRPDPKRRSPGTRPGRGSDGDPRAGAVARRASPGAAAPKPRPADSIPPTRSGVDRRGGRSQQSEQRLGFTARRAAILAAVICVLTLTIAGPVRTYFAQRTEMKQLAASEAAAARADRGTGAAEGQARRPGVHRGAGPRAARVRHARRHPVSGAAAAGGGRAHGPARLCRRRLPSPNDAVVHVAVAHDRRSPRTSSIPAPADPGPGAPPPAPHPRRPVVDRADLDAVARQLGREPRGVLAIAYRCPNGEPAVVKTAPRLPDGTPFPDALLPDPPRVDGRGEPAGILGADEGDDRRGSAGDPELAARIPARPRELSGRARRRRTAGHHVLRRRHARPGEVPACADRAFAGQGPRREPVGRRGAWRCWPTDPAMDGIG